MSFIVLIVTKRDIREIFFIFIQNNPKFTLLFNINKQLIHYPMPLDLLSDASLIKDQVSRIINSQKFRNSPILSDFLNFIVSETLAGKEDQLKEYVIATHVLKKKTDFNPQMNAIVRIHARRLRGSLEEFYGDVGQNDPVRITIPKGRYIPVFEINNTQEIHISSERENTYYPQKPKPVIAILPLKYFDDHVKIKVVASVFCQDLSIELTRFHEIGIISNYSSNIVSQKLNDLQEIGQQLGTGYPIDQKIKVTLELNSIINHQLIWAESYFIDDFDKDRLKNYNLVIRKVVAATCGYFGLIYRNSLNDHIPRDYNHLYAVYWFNHYHQTFTVEALQETMKAVESGLEINPNNALLWTIKGELYLNLRAMNAREDFDYVKTGMQWIQKAIEIDPNCQHAYVNLSWANLLNHNKEEFLRSVNKLISINPNNVMFTGSAGFGYICAGEYEKGLEYMLEAIQLNPYYPWYINFGFCLYYIVNNEFNEALFWADMINRRGFLWDSLIKTSLHGLLGNKKEASKEAAILLESSPDFPNTGKRIVGTFLLDEQLKKSILHGLKNAGINPTG
jgi:tetratricopeptide (TPR) repeat protein